MTKDKRQKGVVNSVENTARKAISKGEKVLFAGLGALAKVEQEGRGLLAGEKSKVLNELVSEARKIADRGGQGEKFDQVQSSVSNSFESARKKMGGAYDKVIDRAESTVETVTESQIFDQAFEQRLSSALAKLGYPDKRSVESLDQRLGEIEAQLQQLTSLIKANTQT